MARSRDKINLPTNITDIDTFRIMLKVIKKYQPLSSKASKNIFCEAKKEGKRGKETKSDTHTEGTLALFGLITYINEQKNVFVISELGKELLNAYDNEGKIIYSEEEYTALMLKIFSSWHAANQGRDIHPGIIILKLLDDKEMEYYITDHEIAHFVKNPDFKLDSQYDEIKKSILDFRNGNGVENSMKSSKANIFMPSLVSNWKILDKVLIRNMVLNPDGTVLKDEVVNGDKAEETEMEMVSEGIRTEIATETEDDEEAEETAADEEPALLDTKISHYALKRMSRDLIRYYKKIVLGIPKEVMQIVYFGAPGTGKSHNIEIFLKKNHVKSQNIARVIFYSDYSYGDFVGCIRPVKLPTKGMDYQFTAGQLTELLKKCFEKPDENMYLVIEEINRGSAAAIFGDLFQLLDRDSTGKSKYYIKNTDICAYISENPLLKPFFKDGNIWFPSNLNILCTMNTADQNVFILDSAFKRRFQMEYVPIDYSKLKGIKEYIEDKPIFSGTKVLTDMFKDTELVNIISELDSKHELNRNWPTFAALVNALIDIVNHNEGEQISEDKKLGPFFVTKEDLNSKTKFLDKVVYYLKQDVFKYIDVYFNKSYEKIYKEFENTADIFELLLPGE